MKASTREWIAKAEEDFATAVTLARPRKKPLWSPVCFHAQQCVEKYLKGPWCSRAGRQGNTHITSSLAATLHRLRVGPYHQHHHCIDLLISLLHH